MVVGHSEIVGKPLSLILLNKFVTTSVCHIATGERGSLPEYVKRAEILVVAVGKANLIKGEWVKDGAIVVDVGINRVGDKLVGDVEFEPSPKDVRFSRLFRYGIQSSPQGDHLSQFQPAVHGTKGISADDTNGGVSLATDAERLGPHAELERIKRDGPIRVRMEEGDRLVVSEHNGKLEVYRPEGYDFFEVLRQKLQHWYIFGANDD